MERYGKTLELDQPSGDISDGELLGVDEYSAIENIQPGNVQNAVNVDFTSRDAQTRGGFVCLPELGAAPFGISWTSGTSAADNTWKSVAYGNGTFVAVASSGTGNRVMTSTDGETWTIRVSAADINWNSVCFGNGLFVAVAASNSATPVMTSPDGITWTARAVSILGGDLVSVIYADGYYVATGRQTAGDSTSPTIIWHSSNGISWTKESTPITSGVTAIAYGNGVYVVVADSTTSPTFNAMYGARVSADAVLWRESTTAVARAWRSVTYGNGTFVAVASSGTGTRIATSTDGNTWTARSAPADNNWESVVFGNGMFMAVSSTGTLDRAMSSQDGITWISRTTPVDNSWKGIAFGGYLFVAVSDDGTGNTRGMRFLFSSVYASGIYSDPDDSGSQWIMLCGRSSVGFYQFGRQSRSVSLGSYTVTEQSTIVQCNNQVVLFRGSSSVPLYWDGNWGNSFTAVPETTPSVGFETIPYSNQAVYYQNRLWVKNGKDTVSASDVLDFTTYDQLANEFNINTGNSDYIVTTFPFGENSLVVFKNKSIILLQNVQGSLSDVTATEVTRQVGCIGINAVTSVGPDLAYLSDRNVQLLTLTATNNAVQHKTLPLSSRIQKIMRRVNWNYAYKASLAFWDNKLYVALPLDNATYCNTVVVYNFVTEQWFGEWSFSDSINMQIQGWAVVNYLGLQRLHAITEDGRIFVTDEGFYDISGATVSDIGYDLTTRAYSTGSQSHIQRRAYIDVATNRPSFSVISYSEGANEYSTILSAQTYSRTESWKFNDSTYTATNANNDFNRAYRKDYSTGPDSVQSGASGILPEMAQEIRLPLVITRQGRLSWLRITNTQGYLSLMSVGLEVRPGQRGNQALI